MSQRTELFDSFDFYLGPPEMAICQLHLVRDCTFIVQVCWDAQHFESLQLYLGEGLEMAGHLVVTLGEWLAMVTVEFSYNKALWVSIVILVRCMEITGHLAMTLGRDCRVTDDLNHGLEIHISMKLDKVPVLQGNLIIVHESGLETNKIYFI